MTLTLPNHDKAQVSAPSKTDIDFLLCIEDYHRSYTKAIMTDSAIAALPYQSCAQKLFSMQIYYGDAYPHAMALQGLRAEQVIPMCEPLQHKWASERNIWIPPEWAAQAPFRWYWTKRYGKNPSRWALSRILLDQIKQYQPRTVWAFSGISFSQDEVQRWRAHTAKTLLWWSSPLRSRFPYASFDLILSCIPSLVDYFHHQGLQAAYMPHAFDSRILEQIPAASERIPRIAFVGSLTSEHGERVAFLDQLSRRFEIDFYGRGVEFLPEDSPLRERYYGPAWGKELYKIYGSYLLVIHKNISVAGTSASAKRLFEATGMGACMVAEASEDMVLLFEPDREIVTYANFEECAAKISSLLTNPQEALEIGRRAQKRTLQEHSYAQRAQQVLEYTQVLQGR